ncbi:MAG: ribose-phosphate pyrophosphokinase [Phycisphaerales bacterium]|nr:MAG: ribose-phosphate pyrophosphokinase [Phycisphaerales bacterium]
MTRHKSQVGPKELQHETHGNDLKIFGGRGNPALAQRICESLDMMLGRAKISNFPDGETLVKLEEDVRGRDCFIIQSTCPPVDRNLMELLIFIDSLRRASAKRITAVIPYFGYARQDRKPEGRTPITAKLVANLLTEAGAHRVLTMDLHADQIQGFFDIPLDHLTAEPVIADHFRSLNLTNTVIVSPDLGNMKKSHGYVAALGGDIAVIDKRRLDGENINAVNIIGDVKGKNVLMFDDMITTAGTICEAARLLREHGAADIYAAATHGVFAGPALDRLEDADLKLLCVTDTVYPLDEAEKRLPLLKVLSVAELMGKAIMRIHNNESVSELFKRTRTPSRS